MALPVGAIAFLEKLHAAPAECKFSDTLAMIDAHFEYTPRTFKNGALSSASGENAGSAKVLSFASLCGLDGKFVLQMFSEHYRDVLGDPEGTSHGNIRNFMKTGMAGVKFEDGVALVPKPDLLHALPLGASTFVTAYAPKFEDVIAMLDKHFNYTPRRFENGESVSAAGENAGSCKILSFARLAGLDGETVLQMFGKHYRDVLKDPHGTSHGNIRSLMKTGMAGVKFGDGVALVPKTDGPYLFQALPAMAKSFVEQLVKDPQACKFADSIAIMETCFAYTPRGFKNGTLVWAAGENAGSAKIFSFARLAGLDGELVLQMFGEHYLDVLADRGGTAHGNIRNFMETGMAGVTFEGGLALFPKADHAVAATLKRKRSE